jgi:uncharacterized membrane protein
LTPVHAQSFSGLGFLPGGNVSEAVGVNADGTVVAGNSTGEAFRWTQAGRHCGSRLSFRTASADAPGRL